MRLLRQQEAKKKKRNLKMMFFSPGNTAPESPAQPLVSALGTLPLPCTSEGALEDAGPCQGLEAGTNDRGRDGADRHSLIHAEHISCLASHSHATPSRL